MHIRTSLFIIVFAALTAPLLGEPASTLRLVPFPRQVEWGDRPFHLAGPAAMPPFVVADEKLLATALAILAPELERAKIQVTGTSVRHKGVEHAFDILLSTPLNSSLVPTRARLSDPPRPGEYALHVDTITVEIRAMDREGAMNGLATLAQLIRANRRDGMLPGLVIHDWPALRYRAYQDDLTRGPSSTVDELKREVALGSLFKLNVFTYYMEHQYAFEKHPQIGPPDGSLRPEELKSLVEYAAPLGVQILGNQQSFGHFAHILKHEKYAPLRETGDILSPVNEASYQLLDEMYAEVIPLLPFEFFNVCCDETADLGKGPSKALADRIGVGAVYAGHLKRLHDLVTGKYHKRMMMWGDIILNHPDKLALIPKDTVMLTWGYEAVPSFEAQILPFAKSGYDFFVCPGVNCWSRILPDFEKANANIQVFTRDGVKHGALGMLNTAWDDDGESLNSPNWYAYAWGAECAWNGGETKIEDFNRRVGAVTFGETGDHFGQAIQLLGTAERLPGMNGMFNSRFWQLDLDSGSPSAPERRIQANALLGKVRPAIEHLKACAGAANANAELLASFQFGAERMELIARRIIDQQEAARLYAQASQPVEGAPEPSASAAIAQAEKLIRALRDRHRDLGDEWRKLWLRENRPYALDWSANRYAAAVKTYDGILTRMAGAQETLKSGKPLPSVEAIGLGLAGTATSRPN